MAFNDRIILYDSKWREFGRTATEFQQISSIVYDEIGDQIYFTDVRTNLNGSIYSLGRDPQNPHTYVILDNVVAKIHEEEQIRGLAFDPVERSLYWSDETLKRIYKLDVRQKKAEPTIWMEFDHEIPQALAVDICRRFLYWTTDNDNVTTIERASLTNPAKHTVLINERLQRPIALEIDQFSNRMFWIDIHKGTQVSVESANLHGGDRKTLYDGAGKKLRDLIVDENHILIVDHSNECLYQFNKTEEATGNLSLKNFEKSPRGIIKRTRFAETHEDEAICQSAIYMLKDQKAVSEKKDQIAAENQSNVICLNGQVTVDGHCDCSDGWTGVHCETKLCQNFCFHGKCAVSSTGFPQCSCEAGYTGERCEVAKCSGYCLNGGRCDLENQEPVCHCLPAFSGRHCEMINSRPVICRAYCEFDMHVPNIDWSVEDVCR